MFKCVQKPEDLEKVVTDVNVIEVLGLSDLERPDLLVKLDELKLSMFAPQDDISTPVIEAFESGADAGAILSLVKVINVFSILWNYGYQRISYKICIDCRNITQRLKRFPFLFAVVLLNVSLRSVWLTINSQKMHLRNTKNCFGLLPTPTRLKFNFCLGSKLLGGSADAILSAWVNACLRLYRI